MLSLSDYIYALRFFIARNTGRIGMTRHIILNIYRNICHRTLFFCLSRKNTGKANIGCLLLFPELFRDHSRKISRASLPPR